MTEIEVAFEKLTPAERRTLIHRLEERLAADESPEMIAALDAGIRSLEQTSTRTVTREELEQKVRQWSGTAR